ncbi:hypothetical protein EPN95_04605 [Patescibacteria group bacterium]|nr:MAG: hypothetical protein EPN95_04605 [Patescibacteria group bacterium]
MVVKPFHFRKTVTTATAREQVTTARIVTPTVIFQAEVSNTGQVYIGNDQVSATNCIVELDSGDSVELSAAHFGLADAQWDLSDFWMDVSVSTDGAFVGYGERKD